MKNIERLIQTAAMEARMLGFLFPLTITVRDRKGVILGSAQVSETIVEMDVQKDAPFSDMIATTGHNRDGKIWYTKRLLPDDGQELAHSFSVCRSLRHAETDKEIWKRAADVAALFTPAS